MVMSWIINYSRLIKCKNLTHSWEEIYNAERSLKQRCKIRYYMPHHFLTVFVEVNTEVYINIRDKTGIAQKCCVVDVSVTPFLETHVYILLYIITIHCLGSF